MADDLAELEDLYEGTTTDTERAARQELLEMLAARGATIDQLRAAVQDGTLATLPLEFTLGGERKYTLTDVAKKARVDSAYLRQMLLSLGHPNPRHGERAFGEQDVAMARMLRVFLDEGLSREGLLDIGRVIGHSLSRTAAVIREVAGSELMAAGDSEASVGTRYAAAAEQLLPLLGDVLRYELQVHVREQATGDVITRAERAAGELTGTRLVAVAFVDLSGFTRLGSYTSAQRLGMVGSRLAAFASQVAGGPVELVKTLGDGAMFVSPDATALVRAVCELARRVEAEGEEFPVLRGGLSYGPAVNRSADWFGQAVNAAARLVDLAKPSMILGDEAIRERADDAFDWTRKRRARRLKGVEGRQRIYRLRCPS